MSLLCHKVVQTISGGAFLGMKQHHLTTSSAFYVYALALLGRLLPTRAYSCEGSGCCNTTCIGKDCRLLTSGVSVPRWWPKGSCSDLVSHNYDALIPCSKGLGPFDECGGNVPFACGYGLACVAETITYAHCAPICDPHFSDELLHVDSVAAGCTLDGQRGSFNFDSLAERVPVGDVTLVNGSIAVPACIVDKNLYSSDILMQAQLSQPSLAGSGQKFVRSSAQDQESRAGLAAQVSALNLLLWEVWAHAAMMCSALRFKSDCGTPNVSCLQSPDGSSFCSCYGSFLDSNDVGKYCMS
jgi:hypothetical protein